MAEEVRTPRRSTTRIAVATAAILLGGVGTSGWRWYSYVTSGAPPYDDVGIELSSRRMPAPLPAWGSARIAERFPGGVPPHSCQGRVSALCRC